jgi:hypothetical protein
MRKAGSMRTNTKKKRSNSGLCCGFIGTDRQREREKFGKTGSGGRVGPQLIDSPRESSNAPSVITRAKLK